MEATLGKAYKPSTHPQHRTRPVEDRAEIQRRVRIYASQIRRGRHSLRWLPFKGTGASALAVDLVRAEQ
jgi:hypothetical protein